MTSRSRTQVTTPDALPDERLTDAALRPSGLDEFVGQAKVKESLQIAIDAAKQRREPLDHTLFFGPPGLGKTTLALLMAKELGARCGLVERVSYYPPDDLAQIISRSAGILGVPGDAAGIAEIARRSRGTPRVANRLLKRVRDYAQVRAGGKITASVAGEALLRLDVDEFGLDDMDGRILKTIIEQFDGGPVGLTTIAAAVGEDAGTLEEVYEPFLMQQGFLARTPRGRCATAGAYKQFGFTPPRSAEQPTMFDG